MPRAPLITVLLLGGVCTATATVLPPDPNYQCVVYFAESPDIPADVKAELQKSLPGSAVEKCEFIQHPNKAAFFVATPAWKSDSGICHFLVTQFFMANGLRSPWPDQPYYHAQTFAWPERMWFGDRACPRQDTRSYVVVADVSDGVFREIMMLWDRITSSPQAFDDAFALIDNCAGFPLGDLKREVFGRDLRMRIYGVVLRRGHIEGLSLSNFYEVGVAADLPNGENPQGGYDLWIDFTPRGLRVMRCGISVV